MSSTTPSAVSLPTAGPQAGLQIDDTGSPNDDAYAPLVFLGDPVTGRKAGTGSVNLLAAPSVTNPLTQDADNTVTFSEEVREIFIRNLTNYDIFLGFDAAATTASWPVLAGETQSIPIKTTVLHIWPAGGAVSVNVANGVTVRGGV